jgi:3-oxoacyl-[acyl-carrier-protein] synthase II
MKRVVVTGMGCVTPVGNDPETMFKNLCDGKSGLKLINDTYVPYIKPAVVGEPDYTPPTKITGADTIVYYIVEAARQAIADAKLDPKGDNTGVYIGNGAGGVDTIEAGYRAVILKEKKLNPLTILGMMSSSTASAISIEMGITGPVFAINAACAGGAIAIGEGYKAIQSGRIKQAIVGGVEGAICSGMVSAWQKLRALANIDETNPPASSKPFSKDRSGFCLSEGAGALVIEDYDSAVARGATIYGEIAGYGITSDANHWTQPGIEGQTKAMRNAIAESGLDPIDIGYCNAHGTATPVGDPKECETLKGIWGADSDKLLVSSTKGATGHMIGAAGAVEFIVSLLAMKHKIIPPTINISELDPECAVVNIVANTAQPAPNLHAVMSNSFAFGGHNVVLIAKEI